MGYRLLSKYRSELMGCAMLWVMLFHAFDLDLGFAPLNWFRAAGFGGVDIFIVLSAMGLVLSLEKRVVPYEAFMARRAGRILPAYFAVMLPYTLFLILYYGHPWSALVWNSTLLYYWMHSPGAFNWYVAGAMSFYAVTPLCHRKLKSCRSREGLTALGILLSVAFCQLIMQEDFWQYVDVFYRVPLFFLGLLLGFYVSEDRKLGGRDIAFWSFAALFGFAYGAKVYLTGPMAGQWHTPLCHLFLFTTVPMCLVGCWLFEKLPLGLLRKVLRFIGTNSLEIYLLNVSIFCELELLRRFVHFGPSNRLYFLIMIPVNILLGAALHRGVEYIKQKNKETCKV